LDFSDPISTVYNIPIPVQIFSSLASCFSNTAHFRSTKFVFFEPKSHPLELQIPLVRKHCSITYEGMYLTYEG